MTPKQSLPTYAIVELLMRLTPHNETIGSYKNHSVYDDGVIVKTSSGIIHFSEGLVMQQFENPDLISDTALLNAASSFKPTA